MALRSLGWLRAPLHRAFNISSPSLLQSDSEQGYVGQETILLFFAPSIALESICLLPPQLRKDYKATSLVEGADTPKQGSAAVRGWTDQRSLRRLGVKSYFPIYSTKLLGPNHDGRISAIVQVDK